MPTAAVAGPEPWYRGLSRKQWKTMIATNIGWMFDGAAQGRTDARLPRLHD